MESPPGKQAVSASTSSRPGRESQGRKRKAVEKLNVDGSDEESSQHKRRKKERTDRKKEIKKKTDAVEKKKPAKKALDEFESVASLFAKPAPFSVPVRETEGAGDESSGEEEEVEIPEDAEGKVEEEADDGNDGESGSALNLSAASRTVFLGNVPAKLDKKPFGKVESVRFRSIGFSYAAKDKKTAFFKGSFHPERASCNAYVIMAEEDDVQSVIKGVGGEIFEGRHISADRADAKAVHDQRRSVFIGNLAFDCDEEEVWSEFGKIGKVTSVRLVRDPKIGIGKGFGFVHFRDRSSAAQAVQKSEKMKIRGRSIRITRSSSNPTSRKPSSKPSGAARRITAKRRRTPKR